MSLLPSGDVAEARDDVRGSWARLLASVDAVGTREDLMRPWQSSWRLPRSRHADGNGEKNNEINSLVVVESVGLFGVKQLLLCCHIRFT